MTAFLIQAIAKCPGVHFQETALLPFLFFGDEKMSWVAVVCLN
jgi:hypothetical protein